MTQLLKQTAELTVTNSKYGRGPKGHDIELIGIVKIKETDTLVEFIWTNNQWVSTLVITNEVCVDNHFKNALRTSLLSYVCGMLHQPKVNYTYQTSAAGLEE